MKKFLSYFAIIVGALISIGLFMLFETPTRPWPEYIPIFIGVTLGPLLVEKYGWDRKLWEIMKKASLKGGI